MKTCDQSCKFWSYDMDGEYCCHPKSFEIAPSFGASCNRMSLEGYCMTGLYGNSPKIVHELWENRNET
jgi:hypothetical protein